MRGNLYDQVTDHLVHSLEIGVVPWACPWDRSGLMAMPFNAVSDRQYQGVNTLLLWVRAKQAGYASAGWLTFPQITKLGGRLKRLEGAPEGRTGQKSTTIVWAGQRQVEVTDKETGEVRDETRRSTKAYRVFNLDQCEGLPEDILAKGRPKDLPPLRDHERREDIERFVYWTQARITEEDQDRAYYRPSDDRIVLPPRGRFRSASDFEATRFHELVHWTGHASRLTRTFKREREAYAREELCAEIGAAFLCALFQVPGQLQHAEYLKGYIEVLKGDNRAIFEAAASARRAVDYLMDTAWILAQPEAQPEAVGVIAA